MIRTATILAILAVLATSAAYARHRTRHSAPVSMNAPEVREPEIKKVRIIPIVRWQVWCERIGGLEC